MVRWEYHFHVSGRGHSQRGPELLQKRRDQLVATS